MFSMVLSMVFPFKSGPGPHFAGHSHDIRAIAIWNSSQAPESTGFSHGKFAHILPLEQIQPRGMEIQKAHLYMTGSTW